MTTTALTPFEFITAYAERSGVTVEWLVEQGEVVVACACGAVECEGWALLSRESVESNQALGFGWLGGTDYSQIHYPP